MALTVADGRAECNRFLSTSCALPPALWHADPAFPALRQDCERASGAAMPVECAPTVECCGAVSVGHELPAGHRSDSCGVRTHALTDWRLKPAP